MVVSPPLLKEEVLYGFMTISFSVTYCLLSDRVEVVSGFLVDKEW